MTETVVNSVLCVFFLDEHSQLYIQICPISASTVEFSFKFYVIRQRNKLNAIFFPYGFALLLNFCSNDIRQ